MLESGTPSISVCSEEGVFQELFTYAGSGTLFTKERYTQVRDLGLDDFDAAADLIRVGTEDGFLLARSPDRLRKELQERDGLNLDAQVCKLHTRSIDSPPLALPLALALNRWP